ncbi:MAG: hypothetical protein FWE67_08450 [Planctomycetaceae bacterium]|nr:hypothetical protein [Planctomycetaceae bacterium]
MRFRLYLFLFIIAAAIFFFRPACRNKVNVPPKTGSPTLTAEQIELVERLAKQRSSREPEPLQIPVGQTPLGVLREMTNTYQTAKSYCDRGHIQVIGRAEHPDYEIAPWICTAAYQKENETAAKIRLEINNGVLVSNGENCYAQIRDLPEQVLVFPTPQKLTPASLFRDLQLDLAMELGLPETILRFAPQLIMLFAKNPLNTLLPPGSQTEFLTPQYIRDIPCDLIRVSHPGGVRVLWVSRNNKLLLRLDYLAEGLPVPKGIESITSIRIELENAAVNRDISPEAFQMMQPENAKHVSKFQTAESLRQVEESHQIVLNSMEKTDYYAAVLITEDDVVRKKAAQPKAPQTISLIECWTIDNLTPTGNIAVLPQSNDGSVPPILVTTCDGNQLITFDADGNTLKKLKPEGLPGDEMLNVVGITFAGMVGEAYIAAAFSEGQTVYFFDENLKPVNPFTADTLLKEQESFFRRNIQGNPPPSFTPPEGKQLVWSYANTSDKNVDNAEWAMLLSDNREDTFYFTVMNQENQYAAFTPLPYYGDTENLSEPLIPFKYRNENRYLAASADGSVTIFDNKAELLDSFAFGEFITGIAFLEAKGRNLIIVASENSITAWEILDFTP